MAVSLLRHLRGYRGPKEPRGVTVRRSLDPSLLVRIRAVVDQRASYGYRRVAALLNRQSEHPAANHKRVYRVMRGAGLLLARYTGRPARAYDGKVTTPRSDMRWCSDSFEIRGWSGERVHVAFSLDCCDREAIAWVAKPAHLVGEDIRDLMAQSLEARFGRWPAGYLSPDRRALPRPRVDGRNAGPSDLRSAVCLGIGGAIALLACLGLFEFSAGRITSGIIVPAIVEAMLAAGFVWTWWVGR